MRAPSELWPNRQTDKDYGRVLHLLCETSDFSGIELGPKVGLQTGPRLGPTLDG